MCRSNLLDIKPSGSVLERTSECERCIITVDHEHFWDIGICERPALFFGVQFEILDRYFLGIEPDAFPDRFYHRSNDLLGLCGREIEGLLEVVWETGHLKKKKK